MKYQQVSDDEYVVFLKGEDLLHGLKDFSEKSGVTSAVFNGLGSLTEAHIGYFDSKTRRFVSKKYGEFLEITNMNGNIAKKGDETLIHCHVSLAGTDFGQFGGHAAEGCAVFVAEIYVKRLATQLRKELDEKIGLNLFKF